MQHSTGAFSIVLMVKDWGLTVSIFIPSCLYVHVLEKRRESESYFPVVWGLESLSSLFAVVPFLSLFPVSVSDGHIFTSW